MSHHTQPFSHKKKNPYYLDYTYVCKWDVHLSVHACRGQTCQLPLELRLQVAMSSPASVLGTELGQSGRAVNSNYWRHLSCPHFPLFHAEVRDSILNRVTL